MEWKNSNNTPTVDVKYMKFDTTGEWQYGTLARESALEVIINGRSHSLLMQTPGAERELVLGYLFTEGLIDSIEAVGRLEFLAFDPEIARDGRRVEVTLPLLDNRRLPERPSISLSSCGLCGKESLDQVTQGLNRVRSKQHFHWPVLSRLPADLRNHQPLYKSTRGVHAAAVYQADGTFLNCYEDVGRHNAMDKIIGHGLESGWTFDDKLVMLSGRASLEMVIKVVRAGFPLLLCFSSPTAMAVDAAKALNLTLVVRVDNQYLAGYTHTRRLEA